MADIVQDDPRNTDNAWVEATVAHFHDETGEATRTYEVSLADHHLEVGSEWSEVGWVEITPSTHLYSVHEDILIDLRESMITQLAGLKGKKKKRHFLKWRKMRRHALEEEQMQSIQAAHPENIVVKTFQAHYSWYKDLPEEKQRSMMRCIEGAIAVPTSTTSVFAHTQEDFVTGADFFEAVVHNATGLEEAELVAAIDTAKSSSDNAEKHTAGDGHEATPQKHKKYDLSKMSLPWIQVTLECTRNLAGYPFAPGMSLSQRLSFERRAVFAFENLTSRKKSKLVGTYYSLTPGHTKFVRYSQVQGFKELESVPDYFVNMSNQGAKEPRAYTNDMPHGRGIYLTTDHKVSIVVGCQDHFAVTYSFRGFNLEDAHQKVQQVLQQLADALLDTKQEWDAFEKAQRVRRLCPPTRPSL